MDVGAVADGWRLRFEEGGAVEVVAGAPFVERRRVRPVVTTGWSRSRVSTGGS